MHRCQVIVFSIYQNEYILYCSAITIRFSLICYLIFFLTKNEPTVLARRTDRRRTYKDEKTDTRDPHIPLSCDIDGKGGIRVVLGSTAGNPIFMLGLCLIKMDTSHIDTSLCLLTWMLCPKVNKTIHTQPTRLIKHLDTEKPVIKLVIKPSFFRRSNRNNSIRNVSFNKAFEIIIFKQKKRHQESPYITCTVDPKSERRNWKINQTFRLPWGKNRPRKKKEKDRKVPSFAYQRGEKWKDEVKFSNR